MYSFREFFPHNASTVGTPLSGVPGINFYQLPTSTFSLVSKHEYEPGLGSIMDVPMHAFIMALFFQALDIQIFNTDVIIVIDVGP